MKCFSQWILHVISRHTAGLFCALLMMVLYHKQSASFVNALPFVCGVACWLPSFVRIKSSHLWPTLLCRPDITSQSSVFWLFCTMEPSSHSVSVTSFSKNNVTPVFTVSAIVRFEDLTEMLNSVWRKKKKKRKACAHMKVVFRSHQWWHCVPLMQMAWQAAAKQSLSSC